MLTVVAHGSKNKRPTATGVAVGKAARDTVCTGEIVNASTKLAAIGLHFSPVPRTVNRTNDFIEDLAMIVSFFKIRGEMVVQYARESEYPCESPSFDAR